MAGSGGGVVMAAACVLLALVLLCGPPAAAQKCSFVTEKPFVPIHYYFNTAADASTGRIESCAVCRELVMFWQESAFALADKVCASGFASMPEFKADCLSLQAKLEYTASQVFQRFHYIDWVANPDKNKGAFRPAPGPYLVAKYFEREDAQVVCSHLMGATDDVGHLCLRLLDDVYCRGDADIPDFDLAAIKGGLHASLPSTLSSALSKFTGLFKKSAPAPEPTIMTLFGTTEWPTVSEKHPPSLQQRGTQYCQLNAITLLHDMKRNARDHGLDSQYKPLKEKIIDLMVRQKEHAVNFETGVPAIQSNYKECTAISDAILDAFLSHENPQQMCRLQSFSAKAEFCAERVFHPVFHWDPVTRLRRAGLNCRANLLTLDGQLTPDCQACQRIASRLCLADQLPKNQAQDRSIVHYCLSSDQPNCLKIYGKLLEFLTDSVAMPPSKQITALGMCTRIKQCSPAPFAESLYQRKSLVANRLQQYSRAAAKMYHGSDAAGELAVTVKMLSSLHRHLETVERRESITPVVRANNNSPQSQGAEQEEDRDLLHMGLEDLDEQFVRRQPLAVSSASGGMGSRHVAFALETGLDDGGLDGLEESRPEVEASSPGKLAAEEERERLRLLELEKTR